MTTKNKIITLLLLSAGATATTAAINKYIKINAVAENLLAKQNPEIFNWRLGNISYIKRGCGTPLLLLHDLNSASGSFEWNSVISELEKKHTVYAIDLLGCGSSEKPDFTYTNYLYVQLISDFIKSEIGRKTDVIATGGSAALALMTCNNSPELFNQLMFISPDSILECSKVPGKRAKTFKYILNLPIIGTLLYNIAHSKKALLEDFITANFYNPYSVSSINIMDMYYEASHLGSSPKSIYASIRCSYTKCNIIKALKKINNTIYLVGGNADENISSVFEEYKECNPAVEFSIIDKCKRLPQLECPSKLLDIINMYFYAE